jgi:hypothetical protein
MSERASLEATSDLRSIWVSVWNRPGLLTALSASGSAQVSPGASRCGEWPCSRSAVDVPEREAIAKEASGNDGRRRSQWRMLPAQRLHPLRGEAQNPVDQPKCNSFHLAGHINESI